MSGSFASAAIRASIKRRNGRTRLSKCTCSERMPGVRSMIPRHRVGRQKLHERMHAEAEIEIEGERPVFDQQVLVAVLSINDLHLRRGRRDAVQHRTVRRRGTCSAPW